MVLGQFDTGIGAADRGVAILRFKSLFVAENRQCIGGDTVEDDGMESLLGAEAIIVAAVFGKVDGAAQREHCPTLPE